MGNQNCSTSPDHCMAVVMEESIGQIHWYTCKHHYYTSIVFQYTQSTFFPIETIQSDAIISKTLSHQNKFLPRRQNMGYVQWQLVQCGRNLKDIRRKLRHKDINIPYITRVLYDETEEHTTNILIPHQRVITLHAKYKVASFRLCRNIKR